MGAKALARGQRFCPSDGVASRAWQRISSAVETFDVLRPTKDDCEVREQRANVLVGQGRFAGDLGCLDLSLRDRAHRYPRYLRRGWR